jgi:hypothetical protein
MLALARLVSGMPGIFVVPLFYNLVWVFGAGLHLFATSDEYATNFLLPSWWILAIKADRRCSDVTFYQ